MTKAKRSHCAVAAAGAALGALVAYKGIPLLSWCAAGLALFFAICALTRPQLAAPIFTALEAAAALAFRAGVRMVATAVYIVILLPTALVSRPFRRRRIAMTFRDPSAASYFVHHDTSAS